MHFCVCARPCVCVQITPPLFPVSLFLCACTCACASERGDCNRLCNFSALAVAFKIKLALKSPHL